MKIPGGGGWIQNAGKNNTCFELNKNLFLTNGKFCGGCFRFDKRRLRKGQNQIISLRTEKSFLVGPCLLILLNALDLDNKCCRLV